MLKFNNYNDINVNELKNKWEDLKASLDRKDIDEREVEKIVFDIKIFLNTDRRTRLSKILPSKTPEKMELVNINLSLSSNLGVSVKKNLDTIKKVVNKLENNPEFLKRLNLNNEKYNMGLIFLLINRYINLRKLKKKQIDNLKANNLKVDNLKVDNLKVDNLKVDNLK